MYEELTKKAADLASENENLKKVFGHFFAHLLFELGPII